MKNVLKFQLSSIATRQATLTALMLVVVFATMISAHAQVTTGTLRGLVKDPNGAVVPGAKVTISDQTNGASRSTQAGSGGEFEFTNLLPSEYTLTVEATSFKALSLTGVTVSANKVNDVPVELAIGEPTEVVNVSSAGTELQTTTTTLSKEFTSRQVVELAQTSTGAATGINNLALIAPGVTSNGGVGVGAGGSIGGQRPRNNDFIVDGIDNNDKAVTGPQVYVSPETVQEFSLLQNQYSAEYGHSTGGQFITITKSGTNEFHGTAYNFLQNRKLNALDTLQKNTGTVRTLGTDNSIPRYDFNRFGGNVGGPILKNKLFFFTSWEQYALGRAASPGGISAPTAAGLATISALPGISAGNLAIFKQYVPLAPTANAGTIPMCATAYDSAGNCPGPNGGTFLNIPVGTVAFAAPNFQTQKNFMLNIDYTQSSETSHRFRFILNDQSLIDNAATLPVFYNLTPIQGRLFSYTMTHNFTPAVTNETRLAYRRFSQTFQVPNITYPGLDQFPNIGLNDLGINIGPDPNAPQFNIENNYQVVDTLSWNKGAHSFKFGGDFRKLISPQSFVQRQRGDYEYNSSDLFLRDIAPDQLGERSVGASAYYGDQMMLFSFLQDDWRIRPNVTLNLGLSHAYEQLPYSARQQTINSIASVPGVLVFGEPKSQKGDFAPRLGVAWSPNYSTGYLGKVFGGPGQSSIRASFQMAYDVIFDNLYILSLPPQANQTVDVGSNGPGIPGVSTNFIGSGAIGPNPIAVAGNAANARAATSAWIPDQQLPYSQSWSVGYQREFKSGYVFELRYVGTRGVHLLTQNRINVQDRVTNTPGGFLPTFLSAPSQATLDSLTTTLASIQALPRIIPAFSAAGFTSNVAAFLSNGSSIYHGGSAQLTRRYAKGFQLSAAYTWSHLIDDTTAEVFSTVLSPRRVQDFQDLSAERSTSALNHSQRFVASGLYDLKYFRDSKNRWARTLLGGVNFSGTLTVESGEYVTVLSGNDANQNGDSAGDRTIINLNGTPNTASAVTALTRSDGQVVGYLATNPSAQYIQAGNGALADAGRNTFLSPPIQNVDFSVFKNFAITENKKLQIGADFLNAFNHPQYVPGSVNTVDPIATTGVNQYNTIANGLTDLFVPSHIFSSHPRVIQLRFRFTF